MNMLSVILFIFFTFTLSSPIFADDRLDYMVQYENCNVECLKLPDPSANFNKTFKLDEKAMQDRKNCFDKCSAEKDAALNKIRIADEERKEKLAQEQKEQADREAEIARAQQKQKEKEQQEHLLKLIGKKTINECKKEIYYFESILAINPYDAAGKCFLLQTSPMAHMQILSRTKGLIIYPDQSVYVDFGKQSVPAKNDMRTFVVKGDPQPFKYRSAAGSLVTAVKVRVLKDITEEYE